MPPIHVSWFSRSNITPMKQVNQATEESIHKFRNMLFLRCVQLFLGELDEVGLLVHKNETEKFTLTFVG